jgi:hypothetical protein
MRLLALEMQNRKEASRTPLGVCLSFQGWGWLVLLVIAMMAPLSAMAQLSGKGEVTGTVTDKSGAVIPGAAVAATNNNNNVITKTTTTGAGAYNFPNLDPGIYTIVATAKGFETLTQQNVHVNAMETQVYNPVLTVGGADIQITVTAEPPQLETSNATLGATMENDVYAELPVEMGAFNSPDQRRASDFVYLMPGVQGNETNGNATTNVGVINGSGSRGAASAVYVDGVVFVRAGGNGDPRYVWTAISVDAIDQFQVQTTGYSAVYEGQGVMNYTVKQGGSKQHGSVYEFVRNTVFDNWGFMGSAPVTINGAQVVQKPIEHNNEYGINLSGPLVPLGKWKEKIFYYANYNGFRYTATTPTPLTFPTTAQQGGDFSAAGNSLIYDPTTQAACTANNTTPHANYPCRYQFGYGPGIGAGPNGNPILTGTANVIPTTEFSAVAKNMQTVLAAKVPASSIGTALQNNYLSPNATALVNWSTTDRIDYLVNTKDTLTLIAAIGRQASSNPVGQTTTGRNVGPVPFNYGQTYAPKTAVGIIEETHVFTPHLINQFKWGYARYNGPTWNPDQQNAFSATTMGLGNLPLGQAQQTFPIVTFAGTNSQTNWGGTTANSTIAQNYTTMDNLQWTVGKHSLTFGGQVAWMLYNTYAATGGSTPLTLANAVAETSGISGTSATAFTVNTGQGMSYASFLIGEVDKGSFTDYSFHPGYGARFRAISPYFQDTWKFSSKLTFDLGLRYDYFPSVREVHNDGSFFNPVLLNPVTNLSGALQYTGGGANSCNCATPVNTFTKNLGPRLGVAYQLDSKTVIRSSYGIMFTHGDAVGGLASTLGTLGFAASPSFSSSNSVTTMTNLLATAPLATVGQVPAWTPAAGAASGNGYGTGYTNVAGYTAAPSSSNYDDPYLGSRAPEYINWTFGIQRQVTNALAVTATYVGSEGHFIQSDALTGRGIQSNQLNPIYLPLLTTHLADKGATVSTDCTNYNLGCNAAALGLFANSTVNQALSTFLKPFPFAAPADSFGYIGNTNYNAVQLMANLRSWHGLIVNANYTFSRAIDDAGYFRTGYAIPAGTVANHPNAWYPADRIERSVSTSNQPQHLVVTTVWAWPFGKTFLASQAMERAILGGFKFSGIYQAYSGSPLAITESAYQTNPAMTSCSTSCTPPVMNPNFSGSVRQNGRWGKGTTAAAIQANSAPSYIVPSVGGKDKTTGAIVTPISGPFISPVAPSTPANQVSILSQVTGVPGAYDYTFSDAPRTAPYKLYGPGNYQLDLAMVRSFPLHLTAASKLNFRAEWYNVTNHTQFAIASPIVGNANFGQVIVSPTANRKAAQFSARIEF